MRDRFGNHCSIISGYAFKSADLRDEAEVPVIKIGNISNCDDVIIDDSTQYVTSDFLKINEKYHIKNGDILISLTGSHINQPNSMVGRTCRNYSDTEYLLNQRAGKVIVKKNTDKNYMYYLFMLRAIKESIVTRAYGAANQVNISPTAIENMKWEFPDLTTQIKIGESLSFYDQMIVNNNKRIRTLEQMAENLYKEWFVRFRFPGYEDTEFIAGEPKEWKLTKLEDIITIDRGLSYSSEEIDCDEGIDLINLKNIQAFGGFRLDGTKKYSGKYKEQQTVKRGDLVMGVTDMTQDRRTVGSVALIPVVHNTSVISADLIKITSKLSSVFMYSMFKYGGVSKYISQFANGANVLHLRPQVVNRVKVFLPTADIIERFSKILQPMIDEIDMLNESNGNLVKQSDLLLPRLMSGKLQVK